VSLLEPWQARIERGLVVTGAVLTFLLMAATAVDVVMRYVFNSPIAGVWEASKLMLVGIVFLGLASTQAEGGHVRVEILRNRVRGRGGEALDMLGLALGLLIFSLIFWTGALEAWNSWQIQDYTMGRIYFPLWPSKALIPLGSLFLCVRLLTQMVRQAQRLAPRRTSQYSLGA